MTNIMQNATEAGMTPDDYTRRLRQEIGYETQRIDEPKPTDKQIAMVLHALADYPAVTEALKYGKSLDSTLTEEGCVCRWLHDVAYLFEGDS